jgi:D-glycero-D-manno-heptose 1,7-bisphosphate phosphatase
VATQPDVRRRGVFLDRDGVISRAIVRGGRPYPPASLTELELLPGVPEALRALQARGYRLVVVTNQPDVARGTTPKALIDSIHDRLTSQLPLDAVFTCLHDDADRCECRKPLPGLIARAAEELQIDRMTSYLVGDRWRDIEAGRRAGCRTVFVDHGYDEPRPQSYDFRVTSLLEAAEIILCTDFPA